MADVSRDYRQLEWRTGRKLVRTIYAVTHEDWEQHPLIGVMDTPELATEAMLTHNARLASERAEERWQSFGPADADG